MDHQSSVSVLVKLLDVDQARTHVLATVDAADTGVAVAVALSELIGAAKNAAAVARNERLLCMGSPFNFRLNRIRPILMLPHTHLAQVPHHFPKALRAGVAEVVAEGQTSSTTCLMVFRFHV